MRKRWYSVPVKGMVAVSAAVNLWGLAALFWGSKDDAAYLMGIGSTLFMVFGFAVLWEMRKQRDVAVDTRDFRFARSRCLERVRDEAKDRRQRSALGLHPETTLIVQEFADSILQALTPFDSAMAAHVVGQVPTSHFEPDLAEYVERIETRLMGWGAPDVLQ